ncbi:MAG: anion permease [Eubacterium sp.]|nr:anion permease [Eubacterium sp.]
MAEQIMEAVDDKLSKKTVIGWICVVALALIIMRISPTELFTPGIRTTLAITASIMCAFAFELVPNAVLALTLVVLYIITGVADAGTALSGFTNPTTWATPAAMLLVGCLGQTRVLKKTCYGCMLKAGGTYRGIVIGMTIASIILGAVIGGGEVCVPMIIIAFALCTALGVQPNSREAATLMMCAFICANAPISYFYNAVVAMAFAAAQTVDPEASVTYMQYLYHSWPMIIFGLIQVVIAFAILRPGKIKGDVDPKEYLKGEYDALGKMDKKDKKMVAILVILFIGLLTMSITGFNIAWVIFLAALLCFLPFVRIGNEESVNAIRISVFLFIGATMGIGAVFASNGVSAFIASIIGPMLAGAGKVASMAIIWFVGVIANFFLTPLAAQNALLPSVVEIGHNAGLNTLPIVYMFRQGVNQLLLPYEIAMPMFMFSYGMVSLKQFVKVMGVLMIANFIFLMAVMIPYWSFIGIF